MGDFIRRLKADVNILIGFVIFIFLIGSAFAISWIFGIGFVFSFGFSIYNHSLGKNPFLPLFLFAGGFIIRFAINWLLPELFRKQSTLDFLISLGIFVIIVLVGWSVKKGKLRF